MAADTPSSSVCVSPPAETLEIKDGVVVHSKITSKTFGTLEHGELPTIAAIVVHQTGGSTGAGTLSKYASDSVGAHFLVDENGAIFQTARINKRAYHVGQIKSRCWEKTSCSKEETKAVKDILFEKGKPYATRVQNLSAHEEKKPYPDRYPNNSDSIGIEVVGALNPKTNKYDDPTPVQNASVQWLVGSLVKTFSLKVDDVYRHPVISYKQESEAQGVVW